MVRRAGAPGGSVADSPQASGPLLLT